MRRSRSYLPQQSIFPFLGMDVLSPSSQMTTQYSPKLNNFDIVKGIPTKRKGFSLLADPADDPVIGLAEFESLQGIKTLIRFTTKRQFALDNSVDPPVWQDVTGSVEWSGSEQDFLDWTSAAGTDVNGIFTKWIIATNGKDSPIYWDGVSETFQQWTPDIQGFQTCRAIRQFFNHLIIANVTLAQQFPQQLNWSETDSLIKFSNGLNFAGATIIPEIDGGFVHMEQLADRMIAYSPNSIVNITYIGPPGIYSTEQVSNQTRLVSGRTIVNIGANHFFLSQENIFLYDGNRLMRTVGDRIYRQYREEIYTAQAYKAFAFHDAARQHVYFVIPISDTDHAVYKLEYDLYNIGASRWTRHQFNPRPTTMGFFSRDSDLRFDSLFCQTTEWIAADFEWVSGSTKRGFPVRVVGAESGQVYLADDTVVDDDTVIVDAYYDSPDFTVPQEFLSEEARWLEIEMELQGSNIDVYFSSDMGDSYVLVDSIGLDPGWKKYKFPVDVIGKTFRYRIRNNIIGGSLYHRWGRVWLAPGGPTGYIE